MSKELENKIDELVSEMVCDFVPLQTAMRTFQARYVAAALAQTCKKQTLAARLIGVHRNSIRNIQRRAAL